MVLKLSKLILFLLLPFLIIPTLIGQSKPIPQGHSHNDYLRERPLFDALEAGMTSIEIDIILVDEAIIVSHDEDEYDLSNTLESMYLTPIKKLIKKRGGALYAEKSRRQIQLLIDLKTKGTKILDVLDKLIQEHKLLFDRRGLDKKWSPLQIVLSGEVDKDQILGIKKYPFFHVDGRCPDIKKNYPSNEMPIISEKYTKHFKWDGNGEPKKRERKKLSKLVAKIHKQGKKVRFWATNDNENMWSYLLDNGVDYINVDDLNKFREFMNSKSK